MLINSDAFSLGQIESKVWAAERLEECVKEHNLGPLNMYILGGWYGLLNFILRIRHHIEISECRSFDLDPEACFMANTINNSWVSDNWSFRAMPGDVNYLAYPDTINCVVNTSSEHIVSDNWFNNIPSGVLCLIQSNNLDIPEHVAIVNSEDELINKFPLSNILYKGRNILPDYTRFMIIGIK